MKETIPSFLIERVKKYKHKPVFTFRKQGCCWRNMSWHELYDKVEMVAMGLMALGIKPQDRVCLLSENRHEWAVCDLAILSSGAINVPIYATSTPKDIRYIIEDSQASTIIISNKGQLDKIMTFAKELSFLKHIILMDDIHIYCNDNRVIGISHLEPLSEDLRKKNPGALCDRVSLINPNDIASIIYTSGTTGSPKGVMLSHDNFLSNVRACKDVVDINERDVSLSFLPLSHVFERTVGHYLMLYSGGRIAYAENMETVPDDILSISPTLMAAVPRFYEKFHARIMEAIAVAPPLKKKLFMWAQAIGKAYAESNISKKRIPLSLGIKHAICDLLVFSKVKKRLGGRLRFFISGGAPLSKELAEFFYHVGILILEGYGLTETSPVISVNRVDKFKFGTVGPVIPGVEVKIAEDGEILVKGPGIMKGYYKKEAETSEALSGGWFHTGDIGIIDEEGFLKITDRKKDIIVTSGGKNVSPQNIENLLKQDPYIAEVLVYGDKRNYLVALIVPKYEALTKYAQDKGIAYSDMSQLVKDARILGLIQKRVDDATADFASYERVKKVALLPQPFSQNEGEVTPTLKLKRRLISEKYKALIGSLYTS